MPLSRHDYNVACVCPMGFELAPVKAMLDEIHPTSPAQRGQNSYVLGKMEGHNVVIAVLAEIGTNSAAAVATQFLNDFPSIRFGLLVGIGGGVPDLEKDIDIRLGDIVVSKPTETTGGVIQYDMGKEHPNGFERTGTLNKPPAVLRAAIQQLIANHELGESQVPVYLSQMMEKYSKMKNNYARPSAEDQLFETSYNHQIGKTCANCDSTHVIRRPIRSDSNPVIHYGTIGSANRVVKNAAEREKLKSSGQGIICVEMEAAGLVDSFPCLVIRGICDYADSHKNKEWQRYAAATAAAYMKELLSVIPRQEMTEIPPATVVAKTSEYDKGLNLYDAPDMSESLFIGRETELNEMASTLQPQSYTAHADRKVLILGGMGGIGKTQLAITYSKRYKNSYSSIFWLNATSEATLNTSLRGVANRVLPPESISRLDDNLVYARLSNWLSELDNSRWLLVFDNYDNPVHYDITKFYPSVAHGSIIITTRIPEDLQGERIKIKHMGEEEDGLRILASRSGRPDIYSDPGSRPLAHRLDGFPLALATAGAFLKQTPIDCTTYLQQYEEVWQVSRTRVSQLPEYSSRTLYTTWSLSLAQIKDEMPQAAELLAFLAYLDHQDIWYNLLSVDEDISQPSWFRELTSRKFFFVEAMTVLTRYCLLETHHETDSYSLHTCVHDWTLNGLNHEIDVSRYWLAFDCVAHHVDTKDPDDVSGIRYRRFTGHAKRFLHSRFQEATNQYSSIRTRFSKFLNLARLLEKQSQYDAAEQMYLLILEKDRQAANPDTTYNLATINNLALLYRKQDRLDEAEKLLQQALTGYEKSVGLEDRLALNTINNLGLLYKSLGRLDEAEQMYNKALLGKEKMLGRDHTLTLDTVYNLALLYEDLGRLDQAERLYQRALGGYEKTLGRDHPATLNSGYNLAVLYTNQGLLDEAEELFRQALAGYEIALGVHHRHTLSAITYLNNLGLLYGRVGRLDKAEAMYSRALAGKKKALGFDHTSTLDTAGALGRLFQEQGRFDEAEEIFSWALAGYNKLKASSTLPALILVYNMGTLYHIQEKLEKAREMFKRAQSGFEKTLGSEHPYTIDAVDKLKLLLAIEKK